MSLEKRILIVDDDAAIRTLVHTVLRKRGLVSDLARDGVEALERLGNCQYALIVLDLMMPRMSGFELLERIATIPLARRPIVIVLTAGGIPKPFDSTVVAGLLQKPFDIELLLDTITGCLAGIQGNRQLDSCSDVTPPVFDAGDKAN